MKALITCLAGAAIMGCLAPKAVATGGDRWSLTGDMQVTSNPSPPIDPGAPGGGAATWTYLHGDGVFTKSTTNVLADVNPEVPDAGFGWVKADANHISLLKFTLDSNPPPPLGTGNDKTNFKIGDVGGHGTTGAKWTTDHAGDFLVEWLGYNGRNQATADASSQGRLTFLRMSGPGGPGLDDYDVQPLVGGVQDGSANAYSSSRTVSLLGGDSLTLLNEGGDWVGLNLKITELPIPPGIAGDYDDDGDVDGGDFLAWQRALGAAVPPNQDPDGSGNGMIDAADLAVWKSSFGAASALHAYAAVPEPNAAVLLIVCGMMAWRRDGANRDR